MTAGRVAIWLAVLHAVTFGAGAVLCGNGRDLIAPLAATNFFEFGFPGLSTFGNIVICIAVATETSLDRHRRLCEPSQRVPRRCAVTAKTWRT